MEILLTGLHLRTLITAIAEILSSLIQIMTKETSTSLSAFQRKMDKTSSRHSMFLKNSGIKYLHANWLTLTGIKTTNSKG